MTTPSPAAERAASRPRHAGGAPPQAAVGSVQNRLQHGDRAFHDWYRFVLSYPPHLVRDYVERFALDTGDTVLDPFCGTGTTPVECKKLGLTGWGLEAHPMSSYACDVKTDWLVEPDELRRFADRIHAEAASDLSDNGLARLIDDQVKLKADDLLTLPPDAAGLLLKGSLSPLPLHKCLVLLRRLQAEERPPLPPRSPARAGEGCGGRGEQSSLRPGGRRHPAEERQRRRAGGLAARDTPLRRRP